MTMNLRMFIGMPPFAPAKVEFADVKWKKLPGDSPTMFITYVESYCTDLKESRYP